MKRQIFLLTVFLLSFNAFAAPWKFAVFCDSRGSTNGVNDLILGEIADAVVAEGVDLVIVPGDMVNSGGSSQYQQWRSTMAPVYNAGIPVYPVRGNHETFSGTSGWVENFGADIPDNGPIGAVNYTYSVEHKNALFIGIDHYIGNYGKIPDDWMSTLLAANTKLHIFVYAHEPAFKVYHADCLDAAASERDDFVERTLEAGGKVYFCGHDHLLDILRADDGDGDTTDDFIQYLIGTAGAPLYNAGSYDGYNGSYTPVNVEYEKAYGYTIVEIDSSDVTLTWYKRAGTGSFSSFHAMSYTATGPLPPDKTAPTPNPITFSSPPAATGTSSIEMTASLAKDTEHNVQYNFKCITTGSHDSGWQSETYYKDKGLTPNTTYTYRVCARDTSIYRNRTGYTEASAKTLDGLAVVNVVLPANGGVLESYTSQYSASYPASALTNGVIKETGWASSSDPNDQSFIFSFSGGANAILNKAVIYGGTAEGGYFSKDVEIWTSADGTSYTSAGSGTLANSAGSTVKVDLAGIVAKKVKLVITSGYSSYWELAELEVYGSFPETTPRTTTRGLSPLLPIIHKP